MTTTLLLSTNNYAQFIEVPPYENKATVNKYPKSEKDSVANAGIDSFLKTYVPLYGSYRKLSLGWQIAIPITAIVASYSIYLMAAASTIAITEKKRLENLKKHKCRKNTKKSLKKRRPKHKKHKTRSLKKRLPKKTHAIKNTAIKISQQRSEITLEQKLNNAIHNFNQAKRDIKNLVNKSDSVIVTAAEMTLQSFLDLAVKVKFPGPELAKQLRRATAALGLGK